MADPKYIDLLRQGAAGWNAWRSANPKEKADLSGLNPTRADFPVDSGALALVDFAGLKLAPANLAGATLRRVNLAGADLAGVNLSDAFITGSLLRTAKLAGALLSRSRIRDSSLDEADLRKADLNGADIQGCSMCHTRLQDAILGGRSSATASLKVLTCKMPGS